MFFFQSPLALCGSVVVKPAVLRRRIASPVAWTTKRSFWEGDNLPITSYAFEVNHIQMTTDVGHRSFGLQMAFRGPSYVASFW